MSAVIKSRCGFKGSNRMGSPAKLRSNSNWRELIVLMKAKVISAHQHEP